MSLPFPNINPVAIGLGPFKIRWYALAYMTGFILGWRYVLYLIGLDARKDEPEKAGRISKLDIDDFMTWAIIAVILGGRTGYVLLYHFSLYLHDPLEIFALWHGGMSFHGGALGVIIAMVIFARRRKLPVLRLTDLVCCAVPIGLFFGRIANFINGELFGRVTTVPWAIIFPDGGPEPRHPSQLYEAGLEGLILFTIMALLVHRSSIRNRPGILSGVFLIGYSLSRIAIENFRQPDAQIGFLFEGITMGQLLSVPMMIFGAVLIVLALRKPPQIAYAEPV